jgi:hypothetical protein
MARKVVRPQHHVCEHCRQTFASTGGVRRHIAHSEQCRSQRITKAQRAQRAPRRAPSDDMEVNADEEICLPFIPNDIDMNDMHPPFPGDHPSDGLGQEAVEQHHHALDEDEGSEEPTFPRFAEEFAAKPIADVVGTAATPFERMTSVQDASGRGTYAPFADREEWELAQWLIHNVNQRATQEFLKLSIVSVQSIVS